MLWAWELLLFQVSQAHMIISSQNVYNLYAPCYRGPDSDYANLTNFNMAAMLMPKVYENELQVGVNWWSVNTGEYQS